MEHDIKFYIFAVILSVTAIASILTLNIFLIIAALCVASIAIASYKLHYILEAVIFKRTNLIQVVDGCEIRGDRSTAIRRIGNKFCAIAVALLENNTDVSVDRAKIENIIANSHCTFRFLMQVERLDINKLLDKMRTKMIMREIELSRLNNSVGRKDSVKESWLKRQIGQIEHEYRKSEYRRNTTKGFAVYNDKFYF